MPLFIKRNCKGILQRNVSTFAKYTERRRIERCVCVFSPCLPQLLMWVTLHHDRDQAYSVFLLVFSAYSIDCYIDINKY